jgi:hypothetical protein
MFLFHPAPCILFLLDLNRSQFCANQHPPEVASGSLRRLGRGGLTGAVLAGLPLLVNESADAGLGRAGRVGLGEPCDCRHDAHEMLANTCRFKWPALAHTGGSAGWLATGGTGRLGLRASSGPEPAPSLLLDDRALGSAGRPGFGGLCAAPQRIQVRAEPWLAAGGLARIYIPGGRCRLARGAARRFLLARKPCASG